MRQSTTCREPANKRAKYLCVWRVENIFLLWHNFASSERRGLTTNNRLTHSISWATKHRERREKNRINEIVVASKSKTRRLFKIMLFFLSFIDRSSCARPFQFRSTQLGFLTPYTHSHNSSWKNKFFFIMLKTSQTWMEIGNVNWWMGLTRDQSQKKALHFSACDACCPLSRRRLAADGDTKFELVIGNARRVRALTMLIESLAHSKVVGGERRNLISYLSYTQLNVLSDRTSRHARMEMSAHERPEKSRLQLFCLSDMLWDEAREWWGGRKESAAQTGRVIKLIGVIVNSSSVFWSSTSRIIHNWK